MKKILVLFILALSQQFVHAQLSEMLPALSPESLLKQKIGNVEFEISYGRPAARGRKIFGELVPFGDVWRTGAGPGTKLKFDKPVSIGEKIIDPGTYTIATIPDVEKWTILLNSNTKKIFGAQQDGYDEETEIVRLDVPVQKTMYFYESLTFDIDVVNNNAEVIISWESTQVHFPIVTSNNEQAIKTIDQFIAANPNDADNLSYAAYYLELNNQEPERIIDYANRALTIEEDWWYYELKMNSLIKVNRVDEAKKTYQNALKFLRKSKPERWQQTEKNWNAIVKNWPMQ